jgi:chorismate dehydratase
MIPFDYEITELKTTLNIQRIYGYPSEINRLLREQIIDVAPISSAEYLDNSENYLILPDLSISGKNKVVSVALFSNIPIKNVKRVYLSTQSKTSRLLTKVILRKFFGLDVEYLDLKDISEIKKDDAVLLIGDDAIRYLNNFRYYYDLAEVWYRETKLPFVFALWCVNKKAIKDKEKEIVSFYELILESRNKFFANIENHLNKIDVGISREFLMKYLQSLDYSLSNEHKASLELFNKLLVDIGLFQNKTKLKFINKKD